MPVLLMLQEELSQMEAVPASRLPHCQWLMLTPVLQEQKQDQVTAKATATGTATLAATLVVRQQQRQAVLVRTLLLLLQAPRQRNRRQSRSSSRRGSSPSPSQAAWPGRSFIPSQCEVLITHVRLSTASCCGISASPANAVKSSLRTTRACARKRSGID